jgi:pimeloyl-ACP methyl ester carboxylesterase
MSPAATSPDGLELRYEAAGTGAPAIVLVHGWSCDRTYWREQAGAFAARHQVVTIDLAGHGESGAGRVAWTMPAFGDDVVAVVDQLGLERLILVGHSMGGDVVVEAALRLGHRVVGVVWVDTYRTLEEVSTAEELEAFVSPFRRDFAGETRQFVRGMFPPTADPVLVEWIAEDMASAPPDIAIDAMRHALGNDGPILGALDRLGVPIVAINPDDEPTDVESLRRRGVSTVLVHGAGHFPMLEDPAQFNRVLDEVVATLAVSSA